MNDYIPVEALKTFCTTMTTTDYISVEALISYIENKQAEYKIEFDRAIKYFTVNSEYYEGMIDSLSQLEKNIDSMKVSL